MVLGLASGLGLVLELVLELGLRLGLGFGALKFSSDLEYFSVR